MAMRGGGTEDNTVGQSKLGFDFYKIIILNYIKKFYEQMQTVLTPPPPTMIMIAMLINVVATFFCGKIFG